MNGPIEFYRTFQSLLRGRGIEGVLTSGMACVEYGIQQNTKDTDWIVAPALIERLVTLFSVALRQAIYDRGRTRAAALVAATPQEMKTVAMPLDIILP